MKKIIFRFYSRKCTDLFYGKELKYFTSIFIMIFMKLVLSNHVFVNELKIADAFWSILLLMDFIVLIPLSVYRMILISNNRMFNKKLKGNYKFKFQELQYSLKDIMLWIEKADTPDEIYLKSNETRVNVLEVTFDISGKNGAFFDKEIFYNAMKIDYSKLQKTLESECHLVDGQLTVLAVTEYNDPKYFRNMLKTYNIVK